MVELKDSKNLLPASAVQTKPDGSLSLLDQLKRFRGQTEFLTPVEIRPMAASARGDSRAAMGGGARQEQESDIYKVGKAGSKLLFLLNNRGLQTVSFTKGADQPELLARVKATGNYPDDMYYDEANNRLLVLERLYYSEDGSYNYSTAQSRILIYDVSNPTEPKISGEVPVEGQIADSRIVGKVLYIASAIRPESNPYGYGREEKTKGVVTSFDFSGTTIKEVEKMELALPAVSGEQINIQTVVNADGSYSYYLVATLSETGWGWWDRKSMVEVVDISDAKGKIKPLMTVSAKGRLSERSNTLIKDGTLIVTSNYIVDEKATRQIARIAVETFVLPKPGVKPLSEKEVQYRLLHMDLALQGKTDADYDRIRDALLVDPVYGLRGKFYAGADGKLRKAFADSVVTVGDSRGQSASLQDVRVQGNRLYTFWVPTDRVDPLDVFDISAPQAGIKHVQHLEFEGWVSKAVPMQFNGHDYILGLGWITPTVNNERNRQYLQAAVFEVATKRGKLAIDIAAQLTFANTNTWADLNASDKFIEVREDGNGKGQILFAASQYASNLYQSGGKILDFDLAKIDSADANAALSEGAFLSGRSNWLRRVFTNPEIARINTFSDQALAVYDPTKIGADKVTKATAVLELARNIRGYQTMLRGRRSAGVQIVSDWSWYSSGTDVGQTSLRVVDSRAADAELKTAVELKVPGSYVASLVQYGILYILTNDYRSEVDAAGKWSYKSKSYLHSLAMEPKGLNLLKSEEWEVDQSNQSVPPVGVRMRLGQSGRHSSGNLVALPSGAVVVQIDSKLKLVRTSGLQDLTIKGCVTKDRSDLQVMTVNDSLYVASAENVQIPELKSGSYALRNFVAKASLSGTELTCSAEVNIPGRLLTVTPAGSMITDDKWVRDIVTKSYTQTDDKGKKVVTQYQELKTASSLFGLSTGTKATLVDEMPGVEENYYGGQALQSTRAGEFVRISSFGERAQSRPRPYYRPSYNGSMSQDTAFEFIQVDDKGYLSSQLLGVQLAKNSGAQLLGVEKDPTALVETFIGLVRSGRSLQVVRWTELDKRPRVLQLVGLDEKLAELPAADAIASSQSYYGSSYHFSPEQMSFEVLEGMNGVNQFFVK